MLCIALSVKLSSFITVDVKFALYVDQFEYEILK